MVIMAVPGRRSGNPIKAAVPPGRMVSLLQANHRFGGFLLAETIRRYGYAVCTTEKG